ncbi:unnamed protein product [Diamesa tonsa]
MARRRVPKSDVNKTKTKPTQIRECSVVIKKIPETAKTYKGVKILNKASLKPTLLKMGKEAGNKVTQNKKNNPAVVIQEKATKVTKKDNKIRLRECSVAIENKKDESVHVLRNRIVQTESKTTTQTPLPGTSTLKKVSSKRTQVIDSEESSSSVVPELQPTKISARLANRPKRTFVSAKPPAKKVTDTSVQLKDPEESSSSVMPDLQPTKISARLANRPKRTFVSAKPPAKKVTSSPVQLKDPEESSSSVMPDLQPIEISAKPANRSKTNANKSKDITKKVTVNPVQLKENKVQKNKEPIASTSKLLSKDIDENEDITSENELTTEAPVKKAKLKKNNEPIASTSKLLSKDIDENEFQSTAEATVKKAKLKKKDTTIEAPVKEVKRKKKNHDSIKLISKHLSNKSINLKEVEVFSSQNEEDESIVVSKTITKSKTPLTSATKKPVNNSLSSNEPQKSPTYRLKLPIANDDDMDDIYDFPMSSSMIENPKATKVNAVKKKRIRHNGKAGSKLELLMKKSTMNVVGNSCHVQNNPEIYKMKQIEMNKLILAQKTRTNSPKPQLRKVVKKTSTVENISDDDDDDDNVAASSTKIHADTPIVPAISTFKSPVNKNFSGLVMKNPNSSSSPFRINNETIFPRTFYMQLGTDTVPSYSSDCINVPDRRTFNVSSESRKSLESKIPEIFTPITVKPVEEIENDENQAENNENDENVPANQVENDENVPANQVTPVEESLNSNTSIPINNSCESFLGDSNAENVEPIGHKSPSKARKHMSAMRSPLRSPLKSLRSPLKALPIPSQTEFGAVSSPLVVFNLTAQQLMYPKRIGPISTVTSKDIEALKPTKSLDLVDDSVNNEQDDFSKMLAMGNDSVDSDQEEPCTSKQSEAREHLNFDEKLREVQNEFGFDELLEESRSGNKTTSGNNDDVDDEIKMHLQNLKKYLPSRQNKDRTKEIFATSPLKKNKNLFKSPMIDNLTDIRKAFHASTPVNAVKKQQLMRNIFMNTSKIELPVDSVEKDASIEQIEVDEASLIQEKEASIDQQDKSVVEVSDPENSITVNEEVVDEEFIGSNLFNDQSELFNNVSHSSI